MKERYIICASEVVLYGAVFLTSLFWCVINLIFLPFVGFESVDDIRSKINNWLEGEDSTDLYND